MQLNRMRICFNMPNHAAYSVFVINMLAIVWSIFFKEPYGITIDRMFAIAGVMFFSWLLYEFLSNHDTSHIKPTQEESAK